MNRNSTPIDFKLLERVAGLQFTNILKTIGATHVLNVNRFREQEGFDPSIGSIFLFGQGGSYDFDIPGLGDFYVTNGTLATIPGFKNVEGIGKQYHHAAFGESYDDYYEYDQIADILRTDQGINYDNVEYDTLTFDQADQQLKEGRFTHHKIDPKFQRYARGRIQNPRLAIVTLISPSGIPVLVRARYDPQTGRIFKPEDA